MKPENPKKLIPDAVKAPKTKPAAATTRTKPKSATEVPAILLEGDAPSAPLPSGPGQRYALGPAGKSGGAEKAVETAELPEAYGTKRLHLTARDPFWVYACWDLTREQLNHYN